MGFVTVEPIFSIFTLVAVCGESGSGLESEEHHFGRVAQLVRAPASHAGGHRFESCRAHHDSH
jgi:hypothetical protein